MNVRTLIIGDIHGNFDSLKEVLDLANFKIEEDRLIFLGDYIDGYNQPVEVVNFLIDINEKSAFDNIFLMGNHDSWMVNVLNEDLPHFRDQVYIESKHYSWIRQGGKETHEAYLQLTDKQILEHKTKFYDLLKYYHVEDNNLYVHAGYDPDVGFETSKNTNEEVFLWNRSLFERAYTEWNLKRKGLEVDGDSKIDHFETIYIGHTPTVNFGLTEPVKMGNVLNLDQGCKIDGRLTAWVQEDDSFFQTNAQ